jgi:ribosomal protein S18 acetylase RimI-like enzyme
MLKEDYKDILYLDVMPDEKKNVSFYQKHGFSVMEEGTAMQFIGRKWE